MLKLFLKTVRPLETSHGLCRKTVKAKLSKHLLNSDSSRMIHGLRNPCIFFIFSMTFLAWTAFHILTALLIKRFSFRVLFLLFPDEDWVLSFLSPKDPWRSWDVSGTTWDNRKVGVLMQLLSFLLWIVAGRIFIGLRADVRIFPTDSAFLQHYFCYNMIKYIKLKGT